MNKNSTNLLSFTVTEKEVDMRLDAFLKEHLGADYSGKKIKKGIDQYGCKINGKIELFSSTKVKDQDVIEFDIGKVATPKKQPISIVYEDEDFWIINKPAFVLANDEILSKFLGGTCYFVHRIDSQTSGLMIIGKHAKVQKVFEDMFKKRLVYKTYIALVDGNFPHKKIVIQNHLGKIATYEGQAIWGAVDEDKGLHAITHVELLEKKHDVSLLKCMPETGRTHQIRVHLSELGFPILGDHHYARTHTFSQAAPRTLLHAYKLEFKHPKTQKLMTITSPIPEDFSKMLSTLSMKKTI